MPRDHKHDISEAIEALYELHVGVIGSGEERHERPHKPLLLLAVLDLVALGQATPDRVPWCPELRSRFRLYFDQVQKLDDQFTPDNPFFYLRKEMWWQPFRQVPNGEHTLDGTPSVGDANTGAVFARITDPVARWMIRPEDRLQLRDALIARYFPLGRERLSQFFAEASTTQEQADQVGTGEEESESRRGRSSAFRRIILEIYDYQCAACGLRIKLSQIDDLTFVDAAHLIPFSDGENDHPTNGMALCKNHHWAMDRFLIAPSPEGKWQVSRTLDRRRSKGEEELVTLRNEEVLMPSEEAFHPAKASLQWRIDRLVA